MPDRCCDDPCSVVELIHTQFICALNLKLVSWEVLFGHLSELPYDDCLLHQDLLISKTFAFHLNKKYPVKNSYQRIFLKSLLDKAEERDIVHPELYDLYVSFLSLDSEGSGTNFRHFIIDEKYFTIQESGSIVSQGTTGLSIWQGGVFLADWCLQQECLAGKRVLELGSGVGLTGIAVCSAKKGVPQNYTFSDCHPQVIEGLQRNLGLNSSSFTIESSDVHVLELNWEHPKATKLVYDPEVIIAADVVYDQALFEPLINTLKYLLEPENRICFLACTVRNQETLNEFLALLGKKELQAKREPDCKKRLLYQQEESPVHIYSIFHGGRGERDCKDLH